MADPPTYQNRRRFPRVNVDLSVRYLPEGASAKAKTREDRLMTLGEGGCFIVSKLTYPKDTRLSIEFSVDDKTIKVIASVRYSVPFNTKVKGVQFPGMGMQFETIDGADVDMIRKFVSKVQANQPQSPTATSSE